MLRILTGIMLAMLVARAAFAQEVVWIQIEAHQSLRSAEDRVRAYGAQLPNIAGFQMTGSWYAVAIGPYSRPEAESELRALRSAGRVPRDSFVASPDAFRHQFWPIGAQALSNPVLVAPTAAVTAPLVVAPVPDLPDETVREARASEARLSRPEREELQIALRWAGFYNAAIDGSFGRGTRGSMSAWQDAKGIDPTGILTTAQRVTLLSDYNAVLAGLGLTLVRDAAAGIEVKIPTEIVRFKQFEPPFVHYNATGDLNARMLLISQEGTADRFKGLYDVLQTLEVVPLEGERTFSNRSFTIEGVNSDIHSSTYAQLVDGKIKGFMLVWPVGDEARRSRVYAEIRASFQSVEGTLDPAIVPPGADQSVDLLAGLDIRKPSRVASGFYVDTSGVVVTSTDVVGNCARVMLGDAQDADVVFVDEGLGIAALRPTAALAPLAVAAFQAETPRLQSDIAIAGFSYGGLLGAPTLTYGRLADLRGLQGEEWIKRLALSALPGDAGGPVFDGGGAVLGMLKSRSVAGGQVLPENVNFAVDGGAILARLFEAGISPVQTGALAVIDPVDLSAMAADMTVLVSCWN